MPVLDEDDLKSREESPSADQLEKDFGQNFSPAEKSEYDRLAENDVGKGDGNGDYNYRDESPSRLGKAREKLKVVLGGKKRKWIIGGGLGAGAAGLIGGGLLLLPLKIMHITNNIQDRFFASSEQATEDATNRLLKSYLVKKVMPGMVQNKCTSTRVNKSCAVATTGSSPIATLYNAWKDKNLEQKLYSKYGIEIQREGNNKFYLRTDSLQERIFIGDYTPAGTKDFENRAFSRLDRSDVRQEVKRAFENETKWKRVMYKYKVGRLLERKYGIRRCIVACTPRDRLSDKVELKKTAFKSYMVERIFAPRSEGLALAFTCAMNGLTCTDPGSSDANGEKTSQFERDFNARLMEYRDRAGTTSLEDLEKDANTIRDKGFAFYAISRMFGDVTGKVVVKGVPIVGWVDLAAKLISGANNALPAMRKLSYVINSTSQVAMFSMYITHRDEIKTGQVDAELVGSITRSFSADPDPDADQGGLSAESSPLYQEMFGTSKSRTTAMSSVFQTASAAPTYKCNDGEPLSGGKLVCPEESFDELDGWLGKQLESKEGFLQFLLNSPYAQQLEIVADIWNSTFGLLLDKAGGFIGWLGGLVIPGALKDKIAEVVQPLMETFMTWLIPSPFTDKISGARSVNMAIAGGDVAGNDFAHYGLGGKVISSSKAVNIYNQRETEKQHELRLRSLYARVFDTESRYSLVSQLAMSTPSSISSSSQQAMTAVITNPVSTLFSGIGSFLSQPKTLAATNSNDPFGITQYGYTASDPVFTDDPEEYWAREKCDDPDQIKRWGDQGTVDPADQIVDHVATNGCMLLRAAVGSAGAIYTDDVLTSEDLNGATQNAPTNTGGGQIPTKDGWTWPVKDPKIYNDGPCWGGPRMHAGMDINFSITSPVLYAIQSGTVVRVEENRSTNSPGGPPQGNMVQVRVSENVYYNYQHLQPGIKVKIGQQVISGITEIGLVGVTGSTSVGVSKAHLHFGISKSMDYGSYGDISNTMNPINYLPQPAPGGYKCYDS